MVDCQHKFQYLRSHPTCLAKAQTCEHSCNGAGHSKEAHERHLIKHFSTDVKLKQDSCRDTIEKYVDKTRKLYQKRLKQLQSEHAAVQAELRKISCSPSLEPKLLRLIQNNRLQDLTCSNVHTIVQYKNNSNTQDAIYKQASKIYKSYEESLEARAYFDKKLKQFQDEMYGYFKQSVKTLRSQEQSNAQTIKNCKEKIKVQRTKIKELEQLVQTLKQKATKASSRKSPSPSRKNSGKKSPSSNHKNSASDLIHFGSAKPLNTFRSVPNQPLSIFHKYSLLKQNSFEQENNGEKQNLTNSQKKTEQQPRSDSLFKNSTEKSNAFEKTYQPRPSLPQKPNQIPVRKQPQKEDTKLSPLDKLLEIIHKNKPKIDPKHEQLNIEQDRSLQQPPSFQAQSTPHFNLPADNIKIDASYSPFNAQLTKKEAYDQPKNTDPRIVAFSQAVNEGTKKESNLEFKFKSFKSN